MLKSSLVSLSKPEKSLVDTIQSIGYGEMFGVEIDSPTAGEPWVECDLSLAMQDLIEFIRSGVQHIDILTVHNGRPVLAETDFRLNGFRCRKKRKFPTV